MSGKRQRDTIPERENQKLWADIKEAENIFNIRDVLFKFKPLGPDDIQRIMNDMQSHPSIMNDMQSHPMCRCVPLLISHCESCAEIIENKINNIAIVKRGQFLRPIKIKYCPECGAEINRNNEEV